MKSPSKICPRGIGRRDVRVHEIRVVDGGVPGSHGRSITGCLCTHRIYIYIHMYIYSIYCIHIYMCVCSIYHIYLYIYVVFTICIYTYDVTLTYFDQVNHILYA